MTRLPELAALSNGEKSTNLKLKIHRQKIKRKKVENCKAMEAGLMRDSSNTNMAGKVIAKINPVFRLYR